METHNKEEADRILQEQKLPNAEKIRESEEFNPGMSPQYDKFGVPGGGEEPQYYPDRYPPGADPEIARNSQLGGTDADQKEGINVEELDRNIRPTGHREEV